MRRFIHIVKKEFLLEFREKYSYVSSLLYLTAITYVIFKVFGTLDGPTKTGLFWVVFLFTAINIIGSSFSSQGKKRKLSYYQLYDPVDLFMAKLLYNFIKLVLAGLLLTGLQALFSGSVPLSLGLFFKSLLLASAGLTSILCLVSAISSYSDNQNALVSILSLPLVVPVLLLAMRVSLVSEGFFNDPSTGKYLLMMGGIDLLMLSLSVIFIPLIWKS